MMHEEKLQQAAGWIKEADRLLITAGAGIGVDSGLPDFRGEGGFWRAFPPLEKLRMNFASMATPQLFITQPSLAWGFYGLRLNSYRRVQPHAGFDVLRKWAQSKGNDYFVFTSNVDGQFQKAGFAPEKVYECHGSIHSLQCVEPCCNDVWPAEGFEPEVNADTCRISNALPRCLYCQGLARPNIMMFGDWDWVPEAERKEPLLDMWLKRADSGKVVVIEVGAGKAIPTVRSFSERAAKQTGGRLVRINKTEAYVNEQLGVGLEGGGLEVLMRIVEMMKSG